MPSPLPRLRKVCLALPETHEVEAWGEPTFRVKGGKIFAMYAADGNHHGSGRSSVWIKAMPENQALMIRAQPDQYFKPPYVGPSGWVGVYLDKSPDWDEVAELLRDGWKLIGGEKAQVRAQKSELRQNRSTKSKTKSKSKSKAKTKSKSKATRR